jgi:hypothetical protein
MKMRDAGGEVFVMPEIEKPIPAKPIDEPWIEDAELGAETLNEKLLNEGPERMTFDQKLTLFIEAAEKKKVAAAEVKEAEQVLDLLMEDLVDEFLDRDITSIKKSGRTVYFYKQGWAKIHRDDEADPKGNPTNDERSRAVAALRSAGLDEHITIGYMSLSAYMRETLKGGEQLPPEFDGAIDFEERTSLRVRKS